MSGTAKNDLAPVRQIDLRLTRSKRKVAAAGKQGSGTSVLGLKTDRSPDRNIVSRESPNRRLIHSRAGGLRRAPLGPKNEQTREAKRAPHNHPHPMTVQGCPIVLVYTHMLT